MCVFTRAVENVRATKIFARSVGRDRQFVVYSMTIDFHEELAMVLALPVAKGTGEKEVLFLDLKGYPTFFHDLRNGFPPLKSELVVVADDETLGYTTKRKLEVIPVGNFEASFVPTADDFGRLDERFRLPKKVWAKLPKYKNFGFAVFKLKPGAASIHPMAFSFPRANREALFFPTLHIHDGVAHPEAEYDHVLFCQQNPAETFKLTLWDESSRVANGFVKTDKTHGIVEANWHCYRFALQGKMPNGDVFLDHHGFEIEAVEIK
jgi:hypothetical protein